MSPFKISLFSRIGSSVLSAIGAIGAIGGAVSAIIGEYFYNFNQQTIGAFTGGDDDNRIENTSPTKPEFTFGNALKFDGVNDYVSIPLRTITNISNSFTISFWAKGNTFPIIGNSVSASYIQTLTDGRVIATGIGSFNNPARNNTTWYHYLLTGTNGNNKCYVNGIESTTGTVVSNSTITYNQLGRYSTSHYASTILSEFAIWENAAATAQNAIDLYNSGNGALASDVIASPTAYYRLNESGTDTTAVDSSGNGNDGTLTNFNFDGTDGFVRHGYYKELSPYTGIAADFDGTASKIVSTDLMTTLKEGSNLTECGVFIRFTTPSTGSNKYIICFSDLNANAFTAVYRSTGGQLAFYGRTASTLQSSVTFSDLIDVGETHTLFMNLTSGSVASLYLDGVLQVPSGATNNPFFIDNNFDTVTLGCQNKNSTTAQFFDGSISDAIFLKRPFTESERNAILNNPEFTKTYLVNTVGITWADVKAWYPLTEGEGNIAYDYSDNANHGTWTNAAYVDGLSKGRQLGLQSFSKYTLFNGFNTYFTDTFFSFGSTWVVNIIFKSDNGAGGMSILNDSNTGTNNNLFYLATFNNLRVFDSSGVAASFTQAMSVGEINNICLYYDGVNLNLSTNGQAWQSFVYSGNDGFDVIGTRDGALYWNGLLLYIGVWNNETLIESNAISISSGTPAVNILGDADREYNGDFNSLTSFGTPETIVIPEKETISDIPYDGFGLECNFQNIQSTEQVLNLNVENGYVEYDGHAGSYTDIKQIQFMLKTSTGTLANILTDESDNRIVYLSGNQILSDFGLAGVYINNVETDIILTDTWVQVTVELSVPVDIAELYIGVDAPEIVGYSEFYIDKLNFVEV